MTVIAETSINKAGQLKSPALISLAFATAFFPRIIEAIGAPAVINFVHFAVVPAVFCITLFKRRNRDREPVRITQLLLAGLFVLLLSMVISAFINQAGLINIAIGFMLLAEPFLLLIMIVYTPMSESSLKWLRYWTLIFGFSNIALAIAQHFLIESGILPVTQMTAADNVQGVFYLSGSGHVVSASVAITFGIYYFSSARLAPVGFRLLALSVAILHLLFADAKQVLLVLGISWTLLALSKLSDIKVLIQYIFGIFAAFYAFLWALKNVPLFAAFNVWIRPEIYGPNGDATILKTTGFRLIPSFYEGPLNWLWGLGPGHTVGRLGGWMVREYYSLLAPLGVTAHPVSQEIRSTWDASYLDSSFFSPMFGWMGIWGDFGIVGMAIYILIWWIIWHFLCQDDFSKFVVITVFVFGCVFSQMEEPGYMLTVTTLIGLRWHELKAKELSSSKRFHVRILNSG